MHTITDHDEQLLDAFWATPPQRPARPISAPIPAYAVTCTTTCAVCCQRVTIVVDWPGRVCAQCRADRPAADAILAGRLAAAHATGETALATFTGIVTNLPPDVADRWDALQAARTRLEMAVRQAERHTMPSSTPDAAVHAQIQAARAALADHTAKVDRTRQNPSNALAPILAAEAAYLAVVAQTTATERAVAMARTELALAYGEGVPF